MREMAVKFSDLSAIWIGDHEAPGERMSDKLVVGRYDDLNVSSFFTAIILEFKCEDEALSGRAAVQDSKLHMLPRRKRIDAEPRLNRTGIIRKESI